jgi:hypothetical protein
LLACLLAIIAAGCGNDPPRDLSSRRALERVFSEGWAPRQQILSAYDKGGLQAAMEAYRLARRQQQPVPRYPLTPERLPPPSLRTRADEIISDGFEWYGLRFALKVPVDWASDPHHDRMWRFYLNAWDPLDGLLAAHAATADGTYLQFATGIACDWIRQNPIGERRNPFAWYDMAVGLRALQLAYLVDAAARDPSTDPETLSTLIAGAWAHGCQLAEPRNFNDLTNHGIYQAAGLLALGRSLPELRGAERWRKVGAGRLRLMFEKSFSSQGVHLEHSPGYHLSMVRLLAALTDSGLTDDPALLALRDKAERALAWMIAPDGTMPVIGDTGPNVVRPASLGLPDSSIAPELAYAVTQGTMGTPPLDFPSDPDGPSGSRTGARGGARLSGVEAPPEARLRVFPEAGYAVFRSGWPTTAELWQQASYLMLTGAFHSRTHKHADDLSFVWYDAGRWLLTDAGRYGYYYGDPKLIYSESTRAHNTVEIDGQDSSRRSPETFGSALTDWGERSGVSYVSGTIRRRWPALRQTRTLVFEPGRWVAVIDELDSTGPHSYEQWFHLAPDLTVTTEGESASAALGDGRSLHIVPLIAPPATTLEAIRGQTEPTMQGWYSSGHRELEPNWAVGYSAEGTATVFATLLCLSAEKPEVDFTGTIIGPNTISLRWRADGHTDGFTLRRSAAPARLEAVPARPPRTR